MEQHDARMEQLGTRMEEHSARLVEYDARFEAMTRDIRRILDGMERRGSDGGGREQ